MDFQSFSKSTLLFEISFYRQAPGIFPSITARPLVYENHPGKKEKDAMWSPGMEGGAARRNWAAPVAGSAGGRWRKPLGTHQGSNWVLSWGRDRAGVGVPRRGRVAAAGSSAPARGMAMWRNWRPG
jgi:hypothetical protein